MLKISDQAIYFYGCVVLSLSMQHSYTSPLSSLLKHVSTCICDLCVSVNVRVWMGAFCTLTWQAVETANLNVLEETLPQHFFFCRGIVDFTCVDDLVIRISWILLRLTETTWPQVEQRKTMEAFHWTLTTCTCSSKVGLFPYFCSCRGTWYAVVGNHSELCRGDTVSFYNMYCEFIAWRHA